MKEFRRFLKKHGGKAENILEVVCDMSKAFLSGIKENFKNAVVTVDWFHVVQLFTSADDKVRKLEAKTRKLPKANRWANLKNAGGDLTEEQIEALAELDEFEFYTAKAWRAKEMLRWMRKAETLRAAKWRLTHFLRHLLSTLDESPILQPIFDAIGSVLNHQDRILARWQSRS